MKLFGNSKNRSRDTYNRNSGEKLTQEQKPQELPEQPTPTDPKKAMLLFICSLFLFVGMVIMCLSLINKSSRHEMPTIETQINDLQYEVSVTPTQPTEPMPELIAPQGVNESQTINVLLFSPGTTSTDALILASFDLEGQQLSLLSIPRDTYIAGNYELPKISQVYHEAEGGDRGAGALMEKVKEMLGFWPDYYFVLNEDSLTVLTEHAGGAVEFEVPEAPDYSSLTAGEQDLNGKKAAQLFAYRSDYTDVETDPPRVQREFLIELARQLADNDGDLVANAKELSAVADTDLSESDLIYLAHFLREISLTDVFSRALPGKEIVVDNVPYYQVNPESALEMLNETVSPLEEALSIYDVNFRQKTGASGDGQYSDFGFGGGGGGTNTNTNTNTNPTTAPTESTAPAESTEATEAPTQPTETAAPADPDGGTPETP